MNVSRDLIIQDLQNSLGREPTEAEIQARIVEVEKEVTLQAAPAEERVQLKEEAEIDEKARAAKDAEVMDAKIEAAEAEQDLKVEIEKQHDEKVDAGAEVKKEADAAALDQQAHDAPDGVAKTQIANKVAIEEQQATTKIEEEKKTAIDNEVAKHQAVEQIAENKKVLVAEGEITSKVEASKQQAEAEASIVNVETVPPQTVVTAEEERPNIADVASAKPELVAVDNGANQVGVHSLSATIDSPNSDASPWLAPAYETAVGGYAVNGTISRQADAHAPEWIETVVPRQGVEEVPDIEDKLPFKLAEPLDAIVEKEREIFLGKQHEKLEHTVSGPSVDYQTDNACLEPPTVTAAEVPTQDLQTNIGIADNREMAHKLVGETADLGASAGVGLLIVGGAMVHQQFTSWLDARAETALEGNPAVEEAEPLNGDDLKAVTQAADKAALEAAERLSDLQEVKAPETDIQAAAGALDDASHTAEAVRNTYALQSLSDPVNFPSLDTKMNEQLTPYLDKLAAFDASVDEAIANGSLNESSRLAMHQTSREEIAADFATDYRCTDWREVNETADRLGVSAPSSSSAENSLSSVFSSASAEVKDRDLNSSWMYALQEVTHHAETGVGGPGLGISTF